MEKYSEFEKGFIKEAIEQGVDEQFILGYLKEAEDKIECYKEYIDKAAALSNDPDYKYKLACDLIKESGGVDISQILNNPKLQGFLSQLGSQFGSGHGATLGGGIAGGGAGGIIGLLLAALSGSSPLAGLLLGGGAGAGLGSAYGSGKLNEWFGGLGGGNHPQEQQPVDQQAAQQQPTPPMASTPPHPGIQDPPRAGPIPPQPPVQQVPNTHGATMMDFSNPPGMPISPPGVTPMPPPPQRPGTVQQTQHGAAQAPPQPQASVPMMRNQPNHPLLPPAHDQQMYAHNNNMIMGKRANLMGSTLMGSSLSGSSQLGSSGFMTPPSLVNPVANTINSFSVGPSTVPGIGAGTPTPSMANPMKMKTTMNPTGSTMASSQSKYFPKTF